MTVDHVRVAIAFLTLASSTLSAQDLTYAATMDTAVYMSTNDYLMYFVNQGDTLGQPVSTSTRERRAIGGEGGALSLWVELGDVAGGQVYSTTTYGISNVGRVVTVDGQPIAGRAGIRVDVLPRFPASLRGVDVGRTWTDSVETAATAPYGETYYRAARTWRVVASRAGTVVMASQGVLALRQGGWQDAGHQSAWWQEVSGEVMDSVWFDTDRHELMRSWTRMDLVGTGGFGDVTMPSGLRSTVDLRRRGF